VGCEGLRYSVLVQTAKDSDVDATPSALQVLGVFLRLGCSSFGGPVAHLGYFRREFVERRQWVTEATYAELVAIAHALPGPGSSQVGFAIGLLRAGWMGALAAWVGFTLPSALLMVAVAVGHGFFTGPLGMRVAHALQLVAVAVVAQAVISMQRTLAPDGPRLLLAVVSAVVVLLVPSHVANVAVIAGSAVVGWAVWRNKPMAEVADAGIKLPRSAGLAAAGMFVGLLLVAVVARESVGGLGAVGMSAAFYRSGALVFGGGHVVLPLLERAFVRPGWIGQGAFLTGYGAVQAMPGPLFTFAAYLGAAMAPTGRAGWYALLGLVGVFLPGLLAMVAVLPFWTGLREDGRFRAALLGMNASVVGILAAALMHPLWTSTVHGYADGSVALVTFAALQFGRVPPWVMAGVAVVAAFVMWLAR
jgi:chromate transporter